MVVTKIRFQACRTPGQVALDWVLKHQVDIDGCQNIHYIWWFFFLVSEILPFLPVKKGLNCYQIKTFEFVSKNMEGSFNKHVVHELRDQFIHLHTW